MPLEIFYASFSKQYKATKNYLKGTLKLVAQNFPTIQYSLELSTWKIVVSFTEFEGDWKFCETKKRPTIIYSKHLPRPAFSKSSYHIAWSNECYVWWAVKHDTLKIVQSIIDVPCIYFVQIFEPCFSIFLFNDNILKVLSSFSLYSTSMSAFTSILSILLWLWFLRRSVGTFSRLCVELLQNLIWHLIWLTHLLLHSVRNGCEPFCPLFVSLSSAFKHVFA